MQSEQSIQMLQTAKENYLHQLNGPTNRLYDNLERKFKSFVDNHPKKILFNIPHPGPPEKYISKSSIESYFVEVQKNRVVSAGTIEKDIYALNLLAQRESSALAPDIRKGVAASVIQGVLEYVSSQKEMKLQEESRNLDPHEQNPYNVLNQEEVSRVMSQHLSSGNKWENGLTAWAITTVTLLRFDSASLLSLKNLLLIHDLPPFGIKTPHDGEEWKDISTSDTNVDGRMLGIIIPPKDQLKKNKKHQNLTAEGVGCYRHKRIERCACGILAFTFFTRVDTERGKISFLQDDHCPNYMQSWRDVKLFDLKYSTANDLYKKMLDNAGVPEWAKVTHMRYDYYIIYYCNVTLLADMLIIVHLDTKHRKVGCSYCTAQGLTPDEVKTMSKHKSDNFDKSYACQVSIPVCCCLAGFLPRKEEYFVPRAMIQIPQALTLEYLASILFPDYNTWRCEIESEHGDKSKGANHFFYKLLPFFVQCIVQDGIYWIQKFPRNPAVQLLLKRLDGVWPNQNYSVWAREKRHECKEIIKVPEDSRNMEKEKLAIELGKARVANEYAIEEKQKLIGDIEYLRSLNNQILSRLNFLRESNICASLSSNNNTAISTGQSLVSVLTPRLLPQQHLQENQQVQEQQQQQEQHHQPQLPQQEQPQAQQQLMHLRSFESKMVPTVESLNSYKTVQNLVEHYYDHAHHLVDTTKESEIIGCQARKMTFSKIKRIHRRVDDKMVELKGSMENAKKLGTIMSRGGVMVAKVEAAQYIDIHERNNLSLHKYEQYLNSDGAFGGRYRGVGRKRKQHNTATT